MTAGNVHRSADIEIAQIANQEIDDSKSRPYRMGNLGHASRPVVSGVDQNPRRIRFVADDICVSMTTQVRMSRGLLQKWLFAVKRQCVDLEITNRKRRIIPTK